MADWLEIPNFPNHLVCKVDDKYYVKSKKRMKGKRLGIESWGVIGGNILKENKDGKVTVRANSHSKQFRYTPRELYDKAAESGFCDDCGAKTGDPLVACEDHGSRYCKKCECPFCAEADWASNFNN